MNLRIALMLAACLVAPPAFADDGSANIDPGFGGQPPAWAGWTYLSEYPPQTPGQTEVPAGFARTADGGFIVAAEFPGGWNGTRIGLIKLDRDGRRVSSFGGNGTGMVIKDAGLSAVRDMAIDSQGRIVVVGMAPGPGISDFAVVRFLPDGSDDPSFAGDGGTQAGFDIPGQTTQEDARSVWIDPDDKIIVTGRETVNAQAALIRFNVDGSIDSSFGNVADGNGGRRGTLLGFRPNMSNAGVRTLRLAGGSYVVTGNVGTGMSWDFATRVLSSDGWPAAFSAGGSESIPFDIGNGPGEDGDFLVDAVLTGGNSALLVGTAGGYPAAVRVKQMIAGGTSTMEIDPSFVGSNLLAHPNRYIGDAKASVDSVATDDRGRALIVGGFDQGSMHMAGTALRLNANGSLDGSFGNFGGKLLMAQKFDGTYSYATVFRRLLIVDLQPVILGVASLSSDGPSDLDVVLTRLKGGRLFRDGFE